MTVSLPKTTSRHVTSRSQYEVVKSRGEKHVYVDRFPSTQTDGVPLSREWFSQSQTFETHFSYHSKGNPKPMWNTPPLFTFTVSKTKRLRA